MLAVDVLVAVVESVDHILVDQCDLATGAGDVDRPGDLLAHGGGLDRGAGVAPNGEGPVIGHEHRRRLRAGQGLHNAAPDGVVPDEGEGPHGDGAAELIAHHGQGAGDRLAARRPGGGVGGVGVDDAADLLIELDDTQREKLLELMEPDEADDVRRLLEYDEGTAGSLMNPVPIILSPEATVAEALAHIRAEEIPPAMAAAVMVTRPPLETPTGKYLGLVHMQKLLRVPPSEPIGHILDTDTEPVSDQASLEELARVLATYDLTIVPIVNESHRLVGAVTIDDVLDALLPEDWRTYDDGTPVRKVGRRFA